jgi:hypothetical protein
MSTTAATPPARRVATTALTLLAMLVVGLVGGVSSSVVGPARRASAAPADASRFVPLAPRRLVDTRTGTGVAAGARRADTTFEVAVGPAGVPGDATSVVLNVTLTAPDGPGWAVVHPAGQSRPATSNVNVNERGDEAANLVVSRIGSGGRIAVHTSVGAHVLVDVAGYFVPSGFATEGRFRGVEPARVVDTRSGLGAGPGPLPVGTTFRLPIAGRAGVPDGGVGSVAVSITAVSALGVGFVQAVPTGGSTPVGASSNLNVIALGQTVANVAVVPLGGDGSITVHTTARAHLLVDVVGWFTGPGSAGGEDGLFVPIVPVRGVDTRDDGPLAAGASLEVRVATVPPANSGLVLNVTAAEPVAPGFLTVFSGGRRPEASNLNPWRARRTVAASALARTAPAGAAHVYTSVTSHVLADVSGWFTPGVPAPATTFGDVRCVVSLHGKGGGGQPTRTGTDGVVQIQPNGNEPGWGGRQWAYGTPSQYASARAVVASAIDAAGCTRVLYTGFSNGGAFAAHLLCRGETFGRTLVGVVIDDPVVDAGVVWCGAPPGVPRVLVWTGAIAIPPGWDCVVADWTCLSGRAIGIDAYETWLGVPRTQSPYTTHRPFSEIELDGWW